MAHKTLPTGFHWVTFIIIPKPAFSESESQNLAVFFRYNLPPYLRPLDTIENLLNGDLEKKNKTLLVNRVDTKFLILKCC